MEETIKIQEGMFKLYSAIQDGERIELSTRFFPKRYYYIYTDREHSSQQGIIIIMGKKIINFFWTCL